MGNAHYAPAMSSALRSLPPWLLPASLAAAAVALVSLVLAGVGRPSSTSTAPIVISSPVNGSTELHPGSMAPDFEATSFDGRPVRISAERGRVLLINFFASWCTECRAEFPQIEQAYEAKHSAGFDVIGVDAFDSGDGRGFYDEMRATFPAVRDSVVGSDPGPIARAYGLTTPALPVSFFINRDGTIHNIYPGRIDDALIKSELSAMGIT